MRVERIVLHPVKAARGVEVHAATLGDTGFDLDRAWAVVDVSASSVNSEMHIVMAHTTPAHSNMFTDSSPGLVQAKAVRISRSLCSA